jgi:hypothetical protein
LGKNNEFPNIGIEQDAQKTAYLSCRAFISFHKH